MHLDKRLARRIIWGIIFLLVLTALLTIFLRPRKVSYWQNCPNETIVLPAKAQTQENFLPADKKNYGEITATWYSREHCLNCSPNVIMANGRPLNDEGLTCAYDGAPLGTLLLLTYSGSLGPQAASCTVTDRIGRDDVIDLTPAVFSQLENLDKGKITIEVSEW